MAATFHNSGLDHFFGCQLVAGDLERPVSRCTFCNSIHHPVLAFYDSHRISEYPAFRTLADFIRDKSDGRGRGRISMGITGYRYRAWANDNRINDHGIDPLHRWSLLFSPDGTEFCGCVVGDLSERDSH